MCCKIYNRQQLSTLSCSSMQKAISCRQTNVPYSVNVWWRKTGEFSESLLVRQILPSKFLKCLVESCQSFLYRLNIPALWYLMPFISNFVTNAKMTYYGFSEKFVICHYHASWLCVDGHLHCFYSVQMRFNSEMEQVS